MKLDNARFATCGFQKNFFLCKQYTTVSLLESFCSRLMAFFFLKYNNLSGGKSPLDTLLSVLQVFSISEAPSGKRDAHHTCQSFFFFVILESRGAASHN